MAFECFEALCDAGQSGRNEDYIYCEADLALVLDGATGLGPGLLRNEESDASWFVRIFAQQFRMAWSRFGQAETALRVSMGEVNRLFRMKAGTSQIDLHRQPSAAMAMAVREGNTLVLLRLGDCSVHYRLYDGRLGTFPESPLVMMDNIAIAQFQAQRQAGLDVVKALESIHPTLVKHRCQMNQLGGYPALTVNDTNLIEPDITRLSTAEVDRLLLCSDGFSALFDDYRALDVEELLSQRTLLSEGLTELRAIELADSELVAHPRLKRHDDASALLIGC